LAPLPFASKRGAIAMLRPGVDLHRVFDLLSPTINTRHTFDEVRNRLRAAGFEDVVRSIDHSELFVRALRTSKQIAPFAFPFPGRTYWLERYD
jgi:hypothetical protein